MTNPARLTPHIYGAGELGVLSVTARGLPDELNGLDFPSGNEGGANPLWMPGGYLPDGTPEVVINVDQDDGKGMFTPFTFGT